MPEIVCVAATHQCADFTLSRGRDSPWTSLVGMKTDDTEPNEGDADSTCVWKQIKFVY